MTGCTLRSPFWDSEEPLNGAALAGAALPPVASTEEWSRTSDSTTIDPSASPGFHRFPFGDMEITVLSDGHFDFPLDPLPIDDPLEFLAYNAAQETREEYFRSRRLPTDRVPLYLSPVLIDSGDQRTLVDTGFGPGEELPPTAGLLGLSLEAAGIAPESIDQVLITHGHPDHHPSRRPRRVPAPRGGSTRGPCCPGFAQGTFILRCSCKPFLPKEL